MKISLITATWNSGPTLRDTLDSVLRQTHTDVEHIVVDGASRDDTLDIVRSYAEPYRRAGKTLRWVSEPDRGLYDAMNKGIAMATGDVVGILNSDDFYSSAGVLETVARAIDGADAVYGDIHYVDPSDLTRPVRRYSSRSFRRWKMLMGFMPAHPSFYCRRRVYQTYGAFDLDFSVAADFEQLLRLIYVNRLEARYVPVDFVTMRTGGVSSSGLGSHRRIIRDHRLAFRKNGLRLGLWLDPLRYPLRALDLLAQGLARMSRRGGVKCCSKGNYITIIPFSTTRSTAAA